MVEKVSLERYVDEWNKQLQTDGHGHLRVFLVPRTQRARGYDFDPPNGEQDRFAAAQAAVNTKFQALP